MKKLQEEIIIEKVEPKVNKKALYTIKKRKNNLMEKKIIKENSRSKYG